MIVELRPPSTLDDVRCPDGEVKDGSEFFPEAGEKPDEDEEEGGESTPPELSVEALLEIAGDERVVCLHRIEGAAGYINVIMQRSDGSLVFCTIEAGAVADPRRKVISGSPGRVVKGEGAGDYLVLLCADGLRYAVWDRARKEYDWLGGEPAAPETKYDIQYRSLPPYSGSPDEFPTFSFFMETAEGEALLQWLSGQNVGAGTLKGKRSVIQGISEKIREFLNETSASGYHCGKVSATSAWRLDAGRSWLPSAPIMAGPDQSMKVRILSATHSDGLLAVRLQLSVRPYTLTARYEETSVTDEWRKIIKGTEARIGEAEETFLPSTLSDVIWLDASSRGFTVEKIAPEGDLTMEGTWLGSMNGDGLPDDIESMGGRLLAIYAKGDRREANILAVSDTIYPFACTGATEITGGRLYAVKHSLRSMSSGQLGDFPLYAFCSDGIRALTPYEGGFRDVQLISRDVPVSADAFAPAVDGVFFVSPRGVMKIAGSTVSVPSLKFPERMDWSGNLGISYIYSENLLILADLQNNSIWLHAPDTSSWETASKDPGTGKIIRHYYAWPETYYFDGRKLGPLRITRSYPVEKRGMVETGTVAFETRPIKFGTPFKEKKLRYAEAIWPDGVKRSLKIYGSNNLRDWHPLGRGEKGALRMRGTGWRYFRFSSYIKRNVIYGEDEKSRYLKPLIYCKIKD